MQKLAALVAGALLALGAWLVLVPWDLSEVDRDGRVLEEGGDDHAPAIALVAVTVVAASVGLLVAPRTGDVAASLAAGGLVTWAALFAWRAGVSRVSGANMFVIPLVGVVLPLTIAAPLLVRAVARRRRAPPDDRVPSLHRSRR